MDEASALIAWGRQVLANRRLQKQRERLQREVQRTGDAVPLANPAGARHSPVPETPETRWSNEVAAALVMDNATPQEHRAEQLLERGGGHEGVSPNRLAPPSKAAYRPMQETAEVVQLKRRIEVAKQSLQELRGLERRNAEAFRRRMRELQSMRRQVEVYREPRQCTAADSLAVKSLGQSRFGAAATSHQRQRQGQPKVGYKEQLEELWELQKAVLKSLNDEKLAGVAVSSLTVCAGDVQNWDDRLWRLLREATFNWKLRLLPSLREFLELVQQLPMLPQREETARTSPIRSPTEYTEVAAALDASLGPVTARVRLPAEADYPALEWLDNLPVTEAVGVVRDVLARAGADTAASLASLIQLSDQKDAQLACLLGEAEQQLLRQDDALEEAHALIGRLQDEQTSLAEDGVALHDAIALLQEKVVVLRSQREERRRQEAAATEELQRHQARIHELRQSLEREAALRSEAGRRTDEAKRSIEDAALQTTLLHEELERTTERQNGVEHEVLRLRRLFRLVKEEEAEATRQRERQDEELRVAQSALQTSREAFMRQRQRQDEDQKAFASIRCGTHGVLSAIQVDEDACADCAKEIDIQRGVAAVVREELAALQAEVHEANKALAAAQRIAPRRE
ncbi:uncharacterized protein Tco025E_00557 [Trypanosoma conorhini]|uniref:Uncharacterized protein n=1 Tax=Trypanosoma conorhini TaxID=83891 RepID=A0A3R7PYH0_9TRYP|nr:uncharacterized protein Tco025E_00557 [Trypanosoma conorhini]RNF27183.1 hypothetical protein Tco025E_00557 [Trypanosoma conorhini]